MEEVDLMENYVLALGIRGYKKWQEKWIRRTESVQEEETGSSESSPCASGGTTWIR